MQRIRYPSDIALEIPAFATLGNGEIDFFVKTIKEQKLYAIEVKSGNKNSKTVQEALERKNQIMYYLQKGILMEGFMINLYDSYLWNREIPILIPICKIGKIHCRKNIIMSGLFACI